MAGLPALLAAAARVPALQAVVDPDDPVFLPPGDMPARIAQACRRTGQAPPDGPAATVRCILDTVHIVGGGARNTLLCQLTADACGLPVLAGPPEAAALGNVLVQTRALGAAPADLDGLRALVRATHELRRFEPAGGDARAWDAAARRIAGRPR